MINHSKTFSIGDTAKIAGVSQKQLRNWEARLYRASNPRRLWPTRLQALHGKTGAANQGHEEADGRRLRPSICQSDGTEIHREGGRLKC